MRQTKSFEWLRKRFRWLHQDQRGEMGQQGWGGGGFAGDNRPEYSPGNRDSGATFGTIALTADPPNRYSGMMWVRKDIAAFCFDLDGTPTRVTSLSVYEDTDPSTRYTGMMWLTHHSAGNTYSLRIDIGGSRYDIPTTLV